METAHSKSSRLSLVRIVTAGPFGKAVARSLAALVGNVQQQEFPSTEMPTPDAWPAADIYVAATWRPVPGLCRSLSDHAFRMGTPFIPLIVDSSTLCLGPIIVPGKSGCWRCWELRLQQHSALPREQSALLRFYEENPRAGPGGYLESFASMCAARIAAGIQSQNHLQELAGHIWQVHMLTQEVSTNFLIGVDGCAWCGLGRPFKNRTYAEIQEELACLRANSIEAEPQEKETGAYGED